MCYINGMKTIKLILNILKEVCLYLGTLAFLTIILFFMGLREILRLKVGRTSGDGAGCGF